MFKLRRRPVAPAAASDLPFCAMCGTTIRVDAASGRCALGHRVAAPGTLAVAAEFPAADDTVVFEPVQSYEVTSPYEATTVVEAPVSYGSPAEAYVDEPTAGIAGEGLYEAYQSADASGRVVTWEDVVAPPATEGGGVYDDYLNWDEAGSGFSSLDVDTSELPVAGEPESLEDSPIFEPLPADLLDELDDAAHARRRAVGTIGATVGFSALAFASIAVLPF